MKNSLSVIGAVIAGCALLFGLSYGAYQMYAFFAPRYTAVDNKVFQESQQYNEGMVRDLENIKMEYLAANDAQKQALKALTLHRFSVYPFDKLPPDLQSFYASLQGS